MIRIKQTDKVNLRILTQFVVGMFLNIPHMSHRHEAKLLKEYERQLYQDNQSRLPYFTAALSFQQMERLFREGVLDKRSFYSFRPHIAMIFRESVAGKVPRLTNEQAIDAHCKLVLEILKDYHRTAEVLNAAVKTFSRCKDKWTRELGRSVHGIKDIPEFTALLLSQFGDTEDPQLTEAPGSVRGRVLRVIYDRNRERCGFIKRSGPDLFFHSRQNPKLDFESLEDSIVSYTVAKDVRDGHEFGVDVMRLK